MKQTVGLWIDHKKAVIVFVTGKEEEIPTNIPHEVRAATRFKMLLTMIRA